MYIETSIFTTWHWHIRSKVMMEWSCLFSPPSPSVAASAALQQAELQHCFWRVSLLQQGMCAPASMTDSCNWQPSWGLRCIDIQRALIGTALYIAHWKAFECSQYAAFRHFYWSDILCDRVNKVSNIGSLNAAALYVNKAFKHICKSEIRVHLIFF